MNLNIQVKKVENLEEGIALSDFLLTHMNSCPHYPIYHPDITGEDRIGVIGKSYDKVIQKGIVACAILYPLPEERNRFLMSDLLVHPAHRGRGLPQKLFEWISKEYRGVEIYANPINERVQKLLMERLGFRQLVGADRTRLSLKVA